MAVSALARTARVVEDGIAKGLHLGAQLFVSVSGAPRGSVAFGERAPGEPMTTDSLMLWLSSTKPVTAVAVARLWERGALALDDRVADHVPEFAQGGKEEITIRHVLTHTAGFRILRFGWPEEPWEEIVRRLCAARKEPNWVPGEKAGYHQSSSWFLLGEIVRRLDGRPFSRYVREEIFEPLDLGDAWVGMEPAAYESYGDRLVPLFDTSKSPPERHGWRRPEMVVGCNPGGNGWGPISALGRFYEMLREGGTLEGVTILAPQTVEALTARHRVGLMDHTFRHRMDWGLGFIPNSAPALREAESSEEAHALPYHYGRHASRRAYGHSGYRSSTAFCDPEHGLVVAVAFNGTPSEADHRRRMNEVCEAIYEDLALAG